MSLSVALSLLAQGNNGNEILSILDIIGSGGDDDDSAQSMLAEPTLGTIEFW